jgi:hypothetical protein
LIIIRGCVVVREPNDDGLVPPVKVLRKRLNGVYRDDGFSGPTRRYVLIVALLVGLASLPTLAAITAGSNELDGGTTGAMDVPFLPPPSSLPGTPPAPSRSPSASPPAGGPPAGDAPEGPAVGGDVVQGHAGERASKPGPSEPDSNAGRQESDDASYDPAKSPPDSSSRPATGDHSTPPGSDPPARPAGPGGSGRPEHPGSSPSRPTGPTPPQKPNEQHRPGRPACHDRGKCGARPSHHHRPDWSRHKHCDNAAHHAHWSHRREGRQRAIIVHIEPNGRLDGARGERADRTADHQRSAGGHAGRVAGHRAQHRKLEQVLRSIVRHRSDDRSASSRRSSMTERPHNLRPSRSAERTHNSRRHHQTGSPSEELHGAARSYRGAHRTDHEHRADDSWAHHRSSRVGRHHAEYRSPG